MLCWRAWVWRTSKRKIASIENGEKEKPLRQSTKTLKPILLTPRPPLDTVWVPQRKPGGMQTPSSSKSSSVKGGSGEPSPPPSYTVASGSAQSPPPPSTPATPFTKMTPTKKAPPCPKTPPPPLPMQSRMTSPHPYAAMLACTPTSPLRTSSFVQQASLASTGRRGTDGKRLPRLMTVTDTFVPTLVDELTIALGESVRLIEEYRDEWCLAQRTTSTEMGVIPRFCLQEVTSS